jgi:organic hydroperoxide reductase OsmC/OhrA
MIAPFPHRYDVELRWKEGACGTASAPPRPDIVGGPPSQFGGRDSWWSPEHLLLSSLSLCLMTTFLALADKAQIKVHGYVCQAQGILEKTKEGIVFTGFSLYISLKPPITLTVKAETAISAA